MPGKVAAYLIKSEIAWIENRAGIKFDIIWNFDTSRFFNLAFLKQKLRIAHVVDWSENFNRRLLCETSDLCLCTSTYLKEDMKKYNSKTFNIGHGYNSNFERLTTEELDEINQKFNIKVGYVGNLVLKYIDWEIIFLIASTNSSIGFYFIGPESESNISKKTSLDEYYIMTKKLNNTFFLGEKPGTKIPGYLAEFDILLLVYKAREYKKQLANPHKVLEYLGSGKVVLATWTEEYKNLNELLIMVDSVNQLPVKFTEIIDNLDKYNSEHLYSLRKTFAESKTYPNKLIEVEKIINRELDHK
jgi:hypothetical protein